MASVDSNFIFSAISGTILSSVLYVALLSDGNAPTVADAVWLTLSVTVTAVTRAFVSHLSDHKAGESPSDFFADLFQKLRKSTPYIAASVPTAVFILLGDRFHVIAGFGMLWLLANTVVLVALGVLAARKSGYPATWSGLIGLATGSVTVLLMIANLVLK